MNFIVGEAVLDSWDREKALGFWERRPQNGEENETEDAGDQLSPTS